MKRNNISILILLFVSLTSTLCAIQGDIRVYVDIKEKVYTSQKVIIVVELRTDALSIVNTRINFPSSSHYIVQPPKSAGYIRTIDINDSAWQVVHYEYELYMLKAGEINIPPIPIIFSASLGYGQPHKEFDIQSKPLTIKVESPAGVDIGKFVLVTDKYSLISEIKPKKKKLIIGDAIEFKITQKANGIPDILLKPFIYQSTKAIRVYDKEPKLENHLKGEFDVSRVDSFIFVATAEGNITIPAKESIWWNSTIQKVEKKTIPAISFEIIENPQIAIDAKRKKREKLILYISISIIMLYIIYKLLSPYMQRWLLHRKESYQKSEKSKFENLLKSLQRENYSEIYSNLYKWVLIVSPHLSQSGFRGIIKIQPSFSKALSQLEDILVQPDIDFDKSNFINELKKFRKVLFKHKESEEYR
ncbi:MAG: BatD family protein, partial [Sulfurovum sp.]|nr:BatD family protein [Sulfurovaceae bacterium]